MKQKIEYFLNAVFYINWKWLVKRQIYPIKATSYIRIKISSFLTSKKYHEKVIDRERKRILEMEEYVNRVPNALIYPQAVLSLESVLLLYWFSIFFPTAFTSFKYINDNRVLIAFLIVLLGLTLLLRFRCEDMVRNNYLKYFEKFSKKDQTWHKKWRKIKIIFFIAPLLLIPLAICYGMLIGVLKF